MQLPWNEHCIKGEFQVCNPTLVYNGDNMTLNFDVDKFKSADKIDKLIILKHMELDFKSYDFMKRSIIILMVTARNFLTLI
jgi:hypothetical protein